MPTSLLGTSGRPFTSRAGAPQVTTGEALREKLSQRRATLAGQSIGFMPWALKVPEPKAGRLNFDAFPFQVEMYEEGVNDKEMVAAKATQVGMSAWSVRWSVYHADTKGWTGLYVFPTKTDMWDFSTLRIKPMIDASDYLRGRQRPDDPDNKGMKGVGLGKVVFRGSESKRGLDSVDCDHIVFDEYDTLDHANIPDAEMRVSSPLSPGLIRRIGVPSSPDWGISEKYDESDGRQWTVRCSACGRKQALSFEENVDLKQKIRVCARCRESIEQDIGGGVWVPQRPDAGRPRGYHVSRLIVPGAKIDELVKQSKKRNPFEVTVFYNKHLGIPFVPEEGRLSKEAIAAAQSRGNHIISPDGYSGDKLVTMGIDVATTRAMTVRISEHLEDEVSKRALWIGEVERFFEHEAGDGPSLEALMDRFGVHMAAIDHLPDGRLSRSFAERFRGRVYVAHYIDGQDKDPRVLRVDDEMATVGVKRTQAIDATFEMVRQQRNHLPANLPEGYVAQMGSLIRQLEEDETGKRVVRYVKRGTADDYAHAEVYDLVATECWLHRQLMAHLTAEEDVTADDMVDFERSRLAAYEPGQATDYYAGGRDNMSSYERDESSYE